MVPRIILLSVLLATLGCGTEPALNSTSNVVSSPGHPFLLAVEPDSFGAGDSLTVSGHGFSYVAPLNVAIVGGVSSSAIAYDISEEGDETLTFVLPDGADTGPADLLVITEGHASNVLPVTVLSTP